MLYMKGKSWVLISRKNFFFFCIYVRCSLTYCDNHFMMCVIQCCDPLFLWRHWWPSIFQTQWLSDGKFWSPQKPIWWTLLDSTENEMFTQVDRSLLWMPKEIHRGKKKEHSRRQLQLLLEVDYVLNILLGVSISVISICINLIITTIFWNRI